MNTPVRQRRSVWLAYGLVVLIWATTPLAIQWGALDTGFTFAAATRMAIGLAFALLLSSLLGLRLPLHRRALQSYLCAGGGLFGAMLGVYWAAQRVDSGLMSVIFGLSPLVTSLLAAFWLGEALLSPLRLAGMLLGLAGLGIIFLDHGQPQLGDGAPAGLGVLLLAVLINAASLVGLKRLGNQGPPLATTVGSLLVATPLFLLAWWLDGAALPAQLSWRGGLSILYLGLFGSVLGFALYYYILHRLDPTRVALILVITPLLSLLVGQAFNSERLPSQVWLGAVVIALGLLLDRRGSQGATASASRLSAR
ncbi:DMT family transporter [Pseudomonas sp. MOB-449]|nr:DMT family transporter [Pseudomonas sp. MOB-449]